MWLDLETLYKVPLPSSTYYTNTQFTIDCSISQSNTSFEITDEETKLTEFFLENIFADLSYSGFLFRSFQK